jgi:hypothetical protein
VLCEGWDQPAVKALILARPTKSTGLYLQMAGRILRPWPGNPGARAVILDHAGCVHEHGLPQEDREFSLEARPKRQTTKGASVTHCPGCFAAWPSGTPVCAECGTDLAEINAAAETERAAIAEREGELVEYAPATQEEKRAAWDGLCATAAEKGFKPGWAYHRYQEQFGVAPPSSFPRPGQKPAGDVSETEKRAEFDRMRGLAAERGYKQGWLSARFNARFGHYPPRAWYAAPAANDNAPARDAGDDEVTTWAL